MASTSTFWQNHRGLVWSNPVADDATHICAALVRPRFGLLLEIALEFGLDRVRGEWEVLQIDEAHEIQRARPAVERIHNNIGKGFALAASGN